MDMPIDFLEKVDVKTIKFVLLELYKNSNSKLYQNDLRHQNDGKLINEISSKKLGKKQG